MGVRGVSPFNGSAPRTRPRSSSKIIRQIGSPWFFGTNSGSVYEPFMGGLFIAGTRRGIEVLAEPIFVRGIAPSMAGTPRAPFIQNHSPNREPLVFRNELRKRVRTFPGRFVYCGNGEGDRSIGGANLRKGHSPFNGRHASCPLYWKLALYRLLLLAQKKLYKTFEWDSILTQFSFSRQPSNKTRHVRYRTKSKRDNRKPAQCQ